MTDAWSDEAVKRPAPKPWEPRAEAWAEKAVAMPAWACTFARTGHLAPEEDRRDNAPAGTVDEQKELVRSRVYEKHWRGVVRLMDQLKAHAGQDWLRAPKDSALRCALAVRMFELDEELDRLHREHRKGAPLILRHFPPIDGTNAGRSVGAVEREKSKSPLFEPRGAGDLDGFDDIAATEIPL